MQARTRRTPRGWKQIVETAAEVASKLVEREVAMEADATSWLTLTPAATEADAPSDEVAGVMAAAAALSRETCAACGGVGDPVRRADNRLTTRCSNCRTSGDDVLPRGWRPPKRDNGPSLLETLIGKYELTAVMNAATRSGNPSTQWPQTFVGGYGTGACISGIGGHGWTHLIRAAYAELVPANGDGDRAYVSQIKEKFGGLKICSNRNTPFWTGFKRMVNRYSQQVCIRCGKPGRMRNVRMTAAGAKYTGGWMRPECPKCRKKHKH